MSRQISYKYKQQLKQINFSYDRFHDIYEAVAAAEGIDLTHFLAMEQQIAMTVKNKAKAAVKNFRQQEFSRMGFSDITLLKEEKS